MGKVHERIDDRLRAVHRAAARVLRRHRAERIATGTSTSRPRASAAPSPCVDDHTVAYLDITASGAETIAHLRENGRITVMFCAFEGPPNIVRLHGTRSRRHPVRRRVRRAVDARSAETRGARAVIVVDVDAGLGLLRLRRPAHATTRASATCCRRTWSARATTAARLPARRTGSASTGCRRSTTTCGLRRRPARRQRLRATATAAP